ncbi:MAG: hypothetical protein HKN60_08565, partial [Rhizobiales bacterium]|nr:hypothetical protein [Hyphomicrobiales bacterium]
MIVSIALLAFAFLQGAKALAETPVIICGEPWPPYIYESEASAPGAPGVSGIHQRNFALISDVTGLDFQLQILPWKRCLSESAVYPGPGSPEIAIDASFSEERVEKYHFVGPMYAWGTAVFYSRDRYPDGLFAGEDRQSVKTIADLREFRFCGLAGHNYES